MSSSTYDRFGPYKDEELPYCGVVLTAPLRQDENVMHVVFVDREQPLFCMPASLFKETVTHHRDLAKFRRDWLLDFGDGVQFDAEYTDEFPFPIVTKYRKTHKPYETINEDTKNLLKTIGLFSVDLTTCWTRLFGIIPIEESQTNAGVPNVVYECWVRIWLVVNYDRGVLEKLNVKTTLHKLIKVSEDERAAIWEAPWNKDHPKFPHISPFEDEEDEMALIEAHLERPLERQLDVIELGDQHRHER